jgi:hypothetical protein
LSNQQLEQTLKLQSDALILKDKKINELEEELKRVTKRYNEEIDKRIKLCDTLDIANDQLDLSKTEEGRILLVKYPDIHYHTNRWKVKRLVSNKVNSICDNTDISHNCGCCNDSPIEVWPYIKEGDIKIFAKGIPISPGQKGYYGGECPDDNWEDKFRNNNMSEIIIKQVQQFFDANPDVDQEEE